MAFLVEKFMVSHRECFICLPENYECGRQYPVVYLNGGKEIEEQIETILEEVRRETKKDIGFLAAGVLSAEWDRDYTPWEAEPPFGNGRTFEGKAGEYLSFLEHELKPYIDTAYCTDEKRERTALAGYSLGGLAAVYALYQTEAFGTVLSLSGSLWYDGFLPYMENTALLRRDCAVYLSLGRLEKKNRNKKMASVSACTQRAAEILKEELTGDVFFEWNLGGHFTEIEKRYGKALVWLSRLWDLS